MRSVGRWVWVVLLTAVASGCDDRSLSEPEATPRPSDVTLPPVATTHEQLAELRVEPRPPYSDDYRRDAFGSAWKDTDRNGCNQRDDVLRRDAVEATTQQQGACDHDVTAGTWIDPYTGRELIFDDLKDPQQAQALQIDHVVPLAEVWRSGARRWREAKRERFANDLDNLLAVDGPTNQSKGADDPAAWRPRKEYQCAYAQRWIDVKHRWQLAIDDSEKNALVEMLGFC